MNWNRIEDGTPVPDFLYCIDVLVYCEDVRTTFVASFITNSDGQDGKFYLSLDFPVKVFEDITYMVTHWTYIILP